MRAISSTRSISRHTSRRQVGARHTGRSAVLVGSSTNPRPVRIARCREAGTSTPSTRPTRPGSSGTVAGVQASRPAVTVPRSSVPPAISRINAAARRLAHSTIAGSGPRSKRYDEPLERTRPRAAARTGSGANWADSRRMSVVSAPISVSAPPMTPASATGRSASAITHIRASSA